MNDNENKIPAVDQKWIEEQKKIAEKSEAIISILSGETYSSAINMLDSVKYLLTFKSIVSK